jgi:3-methyladenine DNA glycosylase AlkD
VTSEVSLRASAFVAERLPIAHRLGLTLADLVTQPAEFMATLTTGLSELADATYNAEQERVAPGSGMTIGVRWPLIHEVERALRPALAETSSSLVLELALWLSGAESREVRLFALPCLRQSLVDDPERSWQALRRIARRARDWITVDSLAEVYARGILAESFRWAELEQLIYSDQAMERRLVGSTLARMPHEVPTAQRHKLDTVATLALIGQLMGDADDQVQKSLSWALRSWSRVDAPAVAAFLWAQADLAVRDEDGYRAWVIRDAGQHQPADVVSALRDRITGIRKRTGSPSTSTAAAVAATFGVAAMADQAVAQQGDRYARSRA